MMKMFLAGALALSLSTGAAGAASLGSTFTGFFALGDSLSDPGNLFAATGGANPPAPYVDGRFSNGPVFTEFLGDRFDTFSNFAQGGARAVDPMTGPLPLHLDQQLQLFQGEAAAGGAEGSLVTLFFGANDLFGALGTVADTQPADPVSLLVDAATSAATAVANAVASIASYGPAQIVVFDLPDIGATPAYATTPLAPLATLATDTFNAVLAGVAGLSTSDTLVSLFDTSAFFETLATDPARFGLDPALLGTPCFTPGLNAAPDCEGFAFVDGVHPTSAVHALFAAQVEAALLKDVDLDDIIMDVDMDVDDIDEPTPVPLPAGLPLLALGLGGLALVRASRNTA